MAKEPRLCPHDCTCKHRGPRKGTGYQFTCNLPADKKLQDHCPQELADAEQSAAKKA